MAKAIYTAEAIVTGGRANGHGRTTDGLLDVQLRLPAEMGGGEEQGTNPEELFAVGYAACFEGAIGVVGRRERAEVGDVLIDSRVSLLPTEERGLQSGGRARRDAASGERSRAGQADRGGGPQGLSVLERDPREHRGQAHRERRSGGIAAAYTWPPPTRGAVQCRRW